MCPCHHIPTASAARKHHFRITFHPSNAKKTLAESSTTQRGWHMGVLLLGAPRAMSQHPSAQDIGATEEDKRVLA